MSEPKKLTKKELNKLLYYMELAYPDSKKIADHIAALEQELAGRDEALAEVCLKWLASQDKEGG